jgi:hypothetical protein
MICEIVTNIVYHLLGLINLGESPLLTTYLLLGKIDVIMELIFNMTKLSSVTESIRGFTNNYKP